MCWMYTFDPPQDFYLVHSNIWGKVLQLLLMFDSCIHFLLCIISQFKYSIVSLQLWYFSFVLNHMLITQMFQIKLIHLWNVFQSTKMCKICHVALIERFGNHVLCHLSYSTWKQENIWYYETNKEDFLDRAVILETVALYESYI